VRFGEPAPHLRGGLLPLSGVVIVLVISWGYVAYMAWGMENMDSGVEWWLMPRMSNWDAVDLALVLAMWVIMMTAMMLPSAVPLLLLLARIESQRRSRGRAFVATSALALGYVSAWAAFSVVATLAQWGLLETRLVTPMMASSSPYLSALLLAAAGAYQFTNLKYTCLSRCQSPLSALMTQRRDGLDRALLLGFVQGAFCIGCCWLLMVLLFVLGVMNLLWIAALSLFVLLEKVPTMPRVFVQLGGAVLLVWSMLVFGRALLP